MNLQSIEIIIYYIFLRNRSHKYLWQVLGSCEPLIQICNNQCMLAWLRLVRFCCHGGGGGSEGGGDCSMIGSPPQSSMGAATQISVVDMEGSLGNFPAGQVASGLGVSGLGMGLKIMPQMLIQQGALGCFSWNSALLSGRMLSSGSQVQSARLG